MDNDLLKLIVLLNTAGILGIAFTAGRYVQRIATLEEQAKNNPANEHSVLVAVMGTKLDEVVHQLNMLRADFTQFRSTHIQP